MEESERRRVASTLMGPSSLEDVAEAIAAFAQDPPRTAYVERRGDRYRWSPAHRGGPYPLLREVARMLELDPHTLVVPCATVEGWTVVAPEGPRTPRPAASAFIEASGDGVAVAKTIREKIGPD